MDSMTEQSNRKGTVFLISAMLVFAAQDGVVGKITAGKGESLAVDQVILEFN